MGHDIIRVSRVSCVDRWLGTFRIRFLIFLYDVHITIGYIITINTLITRQCYAVPGRFHPAIHIAIS